MMRLIDADKLKEYIVQNCAAYDNLQIIDAIDKQPTAFDVDKVAEKLENYFNTTEDKDMRLAYHHAIEIVKGGEVSKC